MNMVYVHGGVSGTPRESLPVLVTAVRPALSAPGALDAVEIAVRNLEDDPLLNAGWGSTLNTEGDVEMDAGIADGATGAIGAVAGVCIRHPITLARRVLHDTPHVLMAGPGAARLAIDLEPLDDTTPEQRAKWEQARAAGRVGATGFGAPDQVDTVGAVALDSDGRLAAGSSTGGVLGKLPGRVGDSAVFGAGFYASRRAAVVGTGLGELFMEANACFRVGLLIEDGVLPQGACEEVIARLGDRGRGSAGLLALDVEGRAGAAYRGASWAVEGPEGRVAPAVVD